MALKNHCRIPQRDFVKKLCIFHLIRNKLSITAKKPCEFLPTIFLGWQHMRDISSDNFWESNIRVQITKRIRVYDGKHAGKVDIHTFDTRNGHTGSREFNARNVSCLALCLYVYLRVYPRSVCIGDRDGCFLRPLWYRTYSSVNYSNVPDVICVSLHKRPFILYNFAINALYTCGETLL